MRIFCIALCAITFLIASCGSSNARQNPPAVKKIYPLHSKLDGAGTNALMMLVNNYYTLKNDLVAEKAGKADSAATILAQAADSMKALLAGDSAVAQTLQPYLDTVANYSSVLGKMDDATCERQRLLFSPISSALYELLKITELKNADIYQEHCPMAFNGKGAYWLSEQAEIKNPYFGKKMLECGTVTDTIK